MDFFFSTPSTSSLVRLMLHHIFSRCVTKLIRNECTQGLSEGFLIKSFPSTFSRQKF